MLVCKGEESKKNQIQEIWKYKKYIKKCMGEYKIIIKIIVTTKSKIQKKIKKLGK